MTSKTIDKLIESHGVNHVITSLAEFLEERGKRFNRDISPEDPRGLNDWRREQRDRVLKLSIHLREFTSSSIASR